MVRRVQAKIRAQRELKERFGDRYKRGDINYNPDVQNGLEGAGVILPEISNNANQNATKDNTID